MGIVLILRPDVDHVGYDSVIHPGQQEQYKNQLKPIMM
jgi:hypothetical protein